MNPESHFRRPSKARVRRIRDRLREIYGKPLPSPHRKPVDELVRTILSQHTSDANRDRAFEQLAERFPPSEGGSGEADVDWAAVRDAPVELVEEAIRCGGLSRQKAPRIQVALERIGEQLDLEWLEKAPREQALGFLTGLPGVGRKTAACILMFTWGRPEIPVDVHVQRVGARLGLFRPGASLEQAHDEMLAITDPADAYELHMNLIGHGRAICRPDPRCSECGLRRMCPYWRNRAGGR